MNDLTLLSNEEYMRREFIPFLSSNDKFVKNFKQSIYNLVDEKFMNLNRRIPESPDEKEVVSVSYIYKSRHHVEPIESLRRRNFPFYVNWERKNKPVSIIDTWIEITEEKLNSWSMMIGDIESGITRKISGVNKKGSLLRFLEKRSLIVFGCGIMGTLCICCCMCLIIIILVAMLVRAYTMYPVA